MSLEAALAADRAGELQVAAAGYEDVLESGERSLGVLLNLAVLYWQATDTGLAAADRLPSEFFVHAGRRFPELLDEAERRFPTSTAARFWKRYIAWTDLGEPLPREECEQLLREDPATLDPAMFLLDPVQGTAKTQAEELLRQCREEGTTRARYVLSVIEGVMKRSGHRH